MIYPIKYDIVIQDMVLVKDHGIFDANVCSCMLQITSKSKNITHFLYTFPRPFAYQYQYRTKSPHDCDGGAFNIPRIINSLLSLAGKHLLENIDCLISFLGCC